jgi:hypothetical protein
MSLLKKITKGVGKLVSKVTPLASMIPGPIGIGASVLGSVLSKTPKVTQAGMALPMLPAVIGAGARVLPGLGRIGTTVGKVVGSRVGKAVGAAATGIAIYDAAGNFLGTRKKYRRMNPMNYRALKRAVKRIKGARKFVRLIDKVGGPVHKSRGACAPKRRSC